MPRKGDLMKSLVLIFLLTFSWASFAGDLHFSCFKNNDPGDYINEPVAFMETNSVSISFMESNMTYLVRVNRTSLFAGYTFDILKMNHEGFVQTMHIPHFENYNDIVPVTDKISCQVSD